MTDMEDDPTPYPEAAPGYTGPWYTAVMDCALCNKRQTVTYPAIRERLECDGCGYMMPAPPLETSDDEWRGR